MICFLVSTTEVLSGKIGTFHFVSRSIFNQNPALGTGTVLFKLTKVRHYLLFMK